MRKSFVLFTLVFCSILFSTSFVFSQEAKKIDELGDVNCESAWEVLDRFAIEIQIKSDAKAYVIFYGGKKYSDYVYDKKKRNYVKKEFLPKYGEAQARVNRWRDYLINNRLIDSSRITFVNGGYREEHTVELFLIPQDAKLPSPTPTLEEKDIKFRKGKARNHSCGNLG